jgi:hypothetical protein
MELPLCFPRLDDEDDLSKPRIRLEILTSFGTWKKTAVQFQRLTALMENLIEKHRFDEIINGINISSGTVGK